MAPITKCDNIVRFHYIIQLALDLSVQIKHLTWKYVFFKLRKKKNRILACKHMSSDFINLKKNKFP